MNKQEIPTDNIIVIMICFAAAFILICMAISIIQFRNYFKKYDEEHGRR